MTIFRCGRFNHGATVVTTSDTPEDDYLTDFADWIKQLSVLMRLSEYQIMIAEQQCEAEYLATVESDFSYRRAKIYLCNGFFGLPRKTQRSVLVHELFHVHMDSLKMPYKSLGSFISKEALQVIEENSHMTEENVVTALESICSGSMPLPPDIKSYRRKPSKKKK